MKIKDNFNKAAKIYNQNAILQKKVASDLIILCSPFITNSSKIIDLGSGTGFLHDFISEKQQISNFFALDLAINMLKESKCDFKINADLNHLPLQKNSFDLVISSLSLQWIVDFKKVFRQIYDILKPNGYFCFSIIAKNSLKNIQSLGIKNLNINQFPDKEFIKNNLQIFSNIKIIEKKITLKYDNYYNILQSMKKIGAGTAINDNYSLGIAELRELMAMKDVFEDWEVIYAIAEK